MTNTHRVVHIISGDLWAGAEAQAYCLLKHLKPYCDLYAVLLNEGTLAEQLRLCGIPVTVYDESQLNAWQIFRGLRATLTKLNPDIVHTHRQKENILGALANATTIRAKCMRTVHGAPEFSDRWKEKLKNLFDHWVGRNLQHNVIAVSDALADQLATLYPPHHVLTIKNGVDTDQLALMAQKGGFDRTPRNTTHIGFVGRLVAVKRVDLFLQIATRLNADQYRFHIIGDGPLRDELENQARDLGVSDRVLFHGHRNDIAACIASLDCLVMCSDHEGTPMTALEALALNTPVLAHAVGGLKEILADFNHLLVTNNKPEAYVKKIKQLHILKAEKHIHLNNEYRAEACAQTVMDAYKHNPAARTQGNATILH